MREKSYLKNAWISDLEDILWDLNFMRTIVRKEKKPVKAVALIEGSSMNASHLLVVRELWGGWLLADFNQHDVVSASCLNQMIKEIQEEINSRGL